MKKIIIFSLSLCFIVYLYNYFTYKYEIKYNINDFTIKETYNNKRYYFEIKKDKLYNFEVYCNKKISKKLIKDIKVINNNSYYCVHPIIKNTKTYPICYDSNKLISYYLIKDKEINKYVDSLSISYKEETPSNEKLHYYNSLSNKTYISLFTYNGFYTMNDKTIKFTKVFNNDVYDNKLSYQLKNNIIMPSYDEKYEFSNMYIFNMIDQKVHQIETKFIISYDAYYAGSYKNNVYLFDNKYNNLYRINTIKKEITLVGSEDKGYIKIYNNKEVKARLNDYKVDKIKYENLLLSNYEFTKYDSLYFNYKDNPSIKTIMYNKNDIKIIKEYKSKVYFIDKETLYEFNPTNGLKHLLSYYEFNFNNKNNIFIYNK
ncbi:MAG: hypothetical protein RR228_01190 [Bacilli bacterium]